MSAMQMQNELIFESLTLSWLLSLQRLCLGVSGGSGHIDKVHPIKRA